MIKLSAEETKDLKAAVEYFDCAGAQSMFDKVTATPIGDTIVMTVAELKAIRDYIVEVEGCAAYGNPMPQSLGCMSNIEEIT